MNKNIIYLAALVSLMTVSCTKHYPFDTIGKAEEGGDAWILSKFTATNVIDFEQGKVTFFQSNDSHVLTAALTDQPLLPDSDNKAYYSYDDLKAKGLLEVPVADGKGNHYRIPTAGEMQMILPEATEPGGFFGLLDFCAHEDYSETVVETAYLDNNEDSTVDAGGAKVSGESIFYYAAGYDDGEPDFSPIFALRFKGTSQYAAYRYDIVKIKSIPDGQYQELWGLRVRAIRLVGSSDVSIDDIKSENTFSAPDAVDLTLPMLCFMFGDENRRIYGSGYGTSGKLFSSSLYDNYGSKYSFVASFSTGDGLVTQDTYGTHMRYPIRPLKCKEDGTL